MKKRTFRVGVIGTGGIYKAAHQHGWRSIPGVEIVAVCDVDERSAAAAAKELGIDQVFTDFDDLVKLDLDAVDVCTPNQVHTPAVVAALKAGKHVLCEKPLATTTAEVRQMGELADEMGLVLMTAQHQRWTPAARAVKAWTKAGRLGQPYHARVRAMRRAWLPIRPGFIDRSLSGGGPCMDIGVHALDLCMWLMDFPTPVRVSGNTKVNFAKGSAIPGLWGEWDRKVFSVEDFAAGFVHFEDGATMIVEAAWLGHQAENEDLSCQVYGLRGGVKWPSGEFASVEGGHFSQGTLSAAERLDKPHTEEIKAFHQAVVRGKPSPVPWTETIKVIAILEAIYDSDRKDAEVKVRL
jgi:predicted dehydrogenase